MFQHLFKELEAVASISFRLWGIATAISGLAPPDEIAKKPSAGAPAILSAFRDGVKYEWDLARAPWTLVNVAIWKGKRMMSRPIDLKRRIPTLHHPFLVRTKKTAV